MFIRMATHFVSLGHKVDLVLMNAAQIEYRDELCAAVRIVDLKTPRLWTSLPAFWRHLRHARPDVVISAMPLANGIAAWAKRLTRHRLTLILTEHNALSMAFGDLEVPRYRLLMWAIRSSYRYANAVVGVSQGVAHRLLNLPGVNEENVHTIYNPAWRPEMEAQAPEAVTCDWLVNRSIPVILALGRLEAQKDFGTLLRAFRVLRERRHARLLILGEGSLRNDLEHLAMKLGVLDDLLMPGFVPNPFAFMARSSVVALSSIHEGFGNVLVEALACGTPVVSTDCPSGPSEILDGGRYGELVPVGDYRSLAAAIERQLDHPLPAETLRARARTFSVETSADAYLQLAEALCGGAR